jgi:hypothetical protein
MTEAEKQLHNYLVMVAEHQIHNIRTINWRYRGFDDLLLKEGDWNEPPETKLPKGVRRGRPKQCYMNAYRLATRLPDEYTYVEGMAIPDVVSIPMGHAWCVDNNGKVVDPTWPLPGKAYFGVHLSAEFIQRHSAKTGVYGVFGGYDKETIKLLQCGFPPMAVVRLAEIKTLIEV